MHLQILWAARLNGLTRAGSHSEFKVFKPGTFFTTIRTNLRGFPQLSFYLSFVSVMQIKDLVLFNKQCYYKKNIWNYFPPHNSLCLDKSSNSFQDHLRKYSSGKYNNTLHLHYYYQDKNWIKIIKIAQSIFYFSETYCHLFFFLNLLIAYWLLVINNCIKVCYVNKAIYLK